MLKKIGIGLVVVLVAFVAVVALQPAEFRVERNVKITAPAEVVFAHVNTMKQWEAWSPWAKTDPAMTSTYEGPEAGVGATHAWSSTGKSGQGKMTIVESTVPTLVRFKLEFLKPFEATNESLFTFQSAGNDTSVTWAMTGRHDFFGKAMCLVMNMDKMVGGDFDKGLAALKAITESEAMARK